MVNIDLHVALPIRRGLYMAYGSIERTVFGKSNYNSLHFFAQCTVYITVLFRGSYHI